MNNAMEVKQVLILGNGHLANKTSLFLSQKGYMVNHLDHLTPILQSSTSSTIGEISKEFGNMDMQSFCMTYVLFDLDEHNLEMVIAIMALYPGIPMATALFNENIRPHLEKASPELTILNPAKIAAPVFVKALENNHEHPVQKAGPSASIHAPHETKSPFLVPLVVTFLSIILFAIVYFHFFEKLSWIDAVYFVVVTISTVGYGDINLQHSGNLSKIIGMVLILSSTGFIWLIFSLLIDRIFKSRAQRLLGRKKYNYKDHIVLCGLGRLGYFIADELQKNGEKVVIIESNQESPNLEYFRSQNIDIYIGNARQPFVLQSVGVAHCRALISVVDDDYANLEIALNARYFQKDILLVLRVFDQSMAAVIKDKFDIHLTQSMSYIAAEKFASIITAK
ncbi:MAG: potassium channel family protein [Bacteroidia bacterium]|nr:potassium channel family protein [Bacteroidia bacterium]